MPTPPLAHFGTTLAEAAPDEGVDPASMPFSGDLERTDRFLSLLGMERFIDNVYPTPSTGPPPVLDTYTHPGPSTRHKPWTAALQQPFGRGLVTPLPARPVAGP